MKKMFRHDHLRRQLIGAFLAIMLVNTLIVVITLDYASRKNRLASVRKAANGVYQALLLSQKARDQLLVKGSADPEFYERPDLYPGMIAYQTRNTKLSQALIMLEEKAGKGSPGLLPIVTSTSQILSTYHSRLDTLIQSILILGFKDFGAIGDMRSEAHALELLAISEEEKIIYLTLRRHEKDFLLRSDPAYFERFTAVTSSGSLTAEVSRDFLSQVFRYQSAFRRVIDLHTRIGIESDAGQWSLVEKSAALLSTRLFDIQEKAEIWEQEQIRKIKLASIFIGALLLVGSMVLALFFSRRITRPILDLANSVKSYVEGELTKIPAAVNPGPTREMNMLNDHIHSMQSTIRQHIEDLEAQKQRAEAANQVKSQFLANISHEIRTPLNGITGTLELLKKPLPKQEEQELMELLYSSSGDLTAVINDILNMSALESGELSLQPVWFDPGELFEVLADPYQDQARNKHLEFEISFEPRNPSTCYGDSFRIGQVFHNLVRNAIKFTHHGEIRIQVRTEENQLWLEIRDTGIGIDPAFHQSIFTPFFQVDPGATRKYGGTGLGLATSQKILRLMGGEISIQSKPGEGSSFVVNIPVRVSAEKRGPQQGANETEISSKKVLIVEDQPVNQKIVSKLLKKMGHEPVVASNGKVGVDYLQNHEVDFVLMDIQMPIMDGISATRAIREWEKDHQLPLTPIIALTANATATDRDAAFSAGMNGFLTKPVNSKQLFSEIALVLTK